MAFYISEDQYKSLLARVNALEENHNNIAIAVRNFASIDQLQELLVLVNTQIDILKTQGDALEDRVQSIEEEPLD